MLTRFLTTVRIATKDAEPVIETIVVGLIFAAAFIGIVEAPWIVGGLS